MERERGCVWLLTFPMSNPARFCTLRFIALRASLASGRGMGSRCSSTISSIRSVSREKGESRTWWGGDVGGRKRALVVTERGGKAWIDGIRYRSWKGRCRRSSKRPSDYRPRPTAGPRPAVTRHA